MMALAGRVLVLSLLFIGNARGNAQAVTADSIVYKDTLIASTMAIEYKPLRAGGGVQYQRNLYRGNGLPASLDNGCSEFKDGAGSGVGFDLRFENPAWGDLSNWTFAPRLSFQQFGAQFLWQAKHHVSTDVQVITEEHALTTTINAITLRPYLSYQFWHKTHLNIAPFVAYYVASSFETGVRILEPGFSLEKDFSVRGKLPEAKRFGAGVEASISTELPLSRTLRALPEIGVALPLLNNASYWSSISPRIGIGFLYDLTPRFDTVPVYEQRKIAVVIPKETVPKEPEHTRTPLTAEIQAQGITKDGERSKILTMEISEVRTRNAFPFLNFIFFDENASAIPSRYVQYPSADVAKKEFKGSEERANVKLLPLYWEILNILGNRLQRYPKAKITLTGSTAHPASETGKIELAKARAETVKKYLVDIWQIDPSRIKVEASLTPAHPSPYQTAQGQEENRRVEITFDEERIGDPITVLNNEHNATPPNIELIPIINADTGIKYIKGSIIGGGQELITYVGNAEGLTKRAWTLTEDAMSRLGDSLRLYLEVVDSTDRKVEAFGSIPLTKTKVTTDKPEKLERFSLILFGFDEATVGKKNLRILNQIAKLLDVNKVERVSVIGYTDESGDIEHNDDLSKRRAEEAFKELGKLTRLRLDQSRLLIEGRGSRDQLYDNALPEGRFFSRTVNITVERAVK